MEPIPPFRFFPPGSVLADLAGIKHFYHYTTTKAAVSICANGLEPRSFGLLFVSPRKVQKANQLWGGVSLTPLRGQSLAVRFEIALARIKCPFWHSPDSKVQYWTTEVIPPDAFSAVDVISA